MKRIQKLGEKKLLSVRDSFARQEIGGEQCLLEDNNLHLFKKGNLKWSKQQQSLNVWLWYKLT